MGLRSAAALLVLLAAAGCGGDDSSFAEDYNRAVRPIAELHGNPGRPGNYHALAARVRRTGANLSKVSAPEGAQDELDGVVRQLRRLADDFDVVAAARKRRDAPRQTRAARALRRDVRSYERAELALKRAIEH
jgi:hypothetical protein